MHTSARRMHMLKLGLSPAEALFSPSLSADDMPFFSTVMGYFPVVHSLSHCQFHFRSAVPFYGQVLWYVTTRD